jgi:hypothetical protein
MRAGPAGVGNGNIVIVIIQCAATKHAEAGRMKSAEGKSVVFVGKPESAPPAHAHSYARPDDLSDAGKSWREALLEYNRTAKNNPLGLYPAYRLYKNQIYERLVDRFGLKNVCRPLPTPIVTSGDTARRPRRHR